MFTYKSFVYASVTLYAFYFRQDILSEKYYIYLHIKTLLHPIDYYVANFKDTEDILCFTYEIIKSIITLLTL